MTDVVDPAVSEAARKLAERSAFIRTEQNAQRRDFGKDVDYVSSGPRTGATLSEVEQGIVAPATESSERGGMVPPPVPATPQPSPQQPVSEAPKADKAPGTEAPSQPAPSAPQGDLVQIPRQEFDELMGKVSDVDKQLQQARAIEERGLAGAAFTKWYESAVPEQRAMIDAVLQGQPLPQPAQSEQGGEDPDLETPSRPQPQPQAVDPETRAALQFLLGRERERQAADAEKAIEDRMLSYPTFKDNPALFDLARIAVHDHLRANPQADVAQTIARYATQYEGLGQAMAKGTTPSTPPAVGQKAPSAPTPEGEFKAPTADDLLKGRIPRMIRERFGR